MMRGAGWLPGGLDIVFEALPAGSTWARAAAAQSPLAAWRGCRVRGAESPGQASGRSIFEGKHAEAARTARGCAAALNEGQRMRGGFLR